jgi:hypothetical protein
VTFPTELLRPTDSALCPFCAGFGGQQDVAHVYGKVEFVKGVDLDAEKLEAMRVTYPRAHFMVYDAFEYVCAPWALAEDVVTVDAWTGTADIRVRAMLLPLLRIAKRVLILGCGIGEQDETIRTLRALGHEPRVVERTEIAVWLVVTK